MIDVPQIPPVVPQTPQVERVPHAKEEKKKKGEEFERQLKKKVPGEKKRPERSVNSVTHPNPSPSPVSEEGEHRIDIRI